MPKHNLSIASRPTDAIAADQASLWLRLQFDEVLTVLTEASTLAEQAQSPELTVRVRQAASSIRALQYALDMVRGGELARNLYELFDYLQRQLLRVDGTETMEQRIALREVSDLLSQVMEAWECEPRLIPTRILQQPALLH